MSYCTTTDVIGVNPKRTYSTTTTPTLAQVQEYVSRIGAEIDVVLQGRGLATPVTSPAELVEFLKQLNATGAAAMAEQAMFPETRGMMSMPAAQVLWKRYRDGMDFIREGNLPTDATGAALPFSFFEQGAGLDAEPRDPHDWQRPKFGKNKEF